MTVTKKTSRNTAANKAPARSKAAVKTAKKAPTRSKAAVKTAKKTSRRFAVEATKKIVQKQMAAQKLEAKKPIPVRQLPPDVLETDTQYPKYDAKNPLVARLTFYQVTGLGWVITTLPIAKGRRGHEARSYAIALDGERQVRVGNGPHVLQRVEVYVTEKSKKRLTRYVELHNKGEVAANVVRDRISSRRAQGALHRALGHKSWMW